MNDISKDRIDQSIKRLASAINRNEVVIDDLKMACDTEEWNDEVVYQLQEAQMLMGEALATLVNWFDGIDETEKESA